MRCWGVGIFDDDLALDIRDLYDNVIKKGFSDSIATAVVMKLFNESGAFHRYITLIHSLYKSFKWK